MTISSTAASAAPMSELQEAVSILARSPSQAARGIRYARGLHYHPILGNSLTLPPEAEPLLAIADRLELKLAGDTVLAFVVAARLHDRRGEADGGWSSPWYLSTYAWHRDAGHGFPLRAEAWMLPPSALQLDAVVADDRGVAKVARRCTLPPAFAGAINARVRRCDGADHHPGHLERSIAMLDRTDARDIDRLTTFEHAQVEFGERPSPYAAT